MGSGIKGVGSEIRRMGSKITALGLEISDHGIGISSFLGIRLHPICGIRDKNGSRFWDQGSEICVQKWVQRRKNIPRYHPDLWSKPTGFQNRFPLHKNAHALFPLFAANFRAHVTWRLRSAISTRQHQNIKKITSLQKKINSCFP